MKKIAKYLHLKCTLWISIAAIIVLIVSLIVPCSSCASILQNIIAGLVTGIVVTLISSLKSKELKDAEIEECFLKTVHDLYISSRREYTEYRKVRLEKNDVYFDGTYELITELQAIESFIGAKDKDERLVRILGKKPSEFFDMEKNYCFAEQKKRHDELYNHLSCKTIFDEEERKTIDQEINAIRKAHSVLNKIILNRSNEIFDEKIEIETSVP